VSRSTVRCPTPLHATPRHACPLLTVTLCTPSRCIRALFSLARVPPVCVTATVLDLPKLFDRVHPDECTWSLDDGALVVLIEKASPRPWASLTLPGLSL